MVTLLKIIKRYDYKSMNFGKTSIYFILFILFIIIFDAYQQQYYLRTYDIIDNGASIPFFDLLISHFIRWCIWAACSVPLVISAWKVFSNLGSSVPSNKWIQILGVGFISWLFSIMLISFQNMIVVNDPSENFNLLGNFEFFIAQKGITFVFAYCVLVLTLYKNAKDIVIDAQWLEIKELTTTSKKNGESNLEPQVSIKIGNKVKLIPLTEVTWIESDDYCVKIHTEQKSYSLRKSLKSLEKQLAPYQFIRVHRGALLNLGYLDQIDFDASLIKLQDSSELPLSKPGAKLLREVLKAHSI
jgi:hypothetical protein